MANRKKAAAFNKQQTALSTESSRSPGEDEGEGLVKVP